MQKELAVITGASGGIGFEITRALSYAGYRIIMACNNRQKGEEKRKRLIEETENPDIEVLSIDLASFRSVSEFADTIIQRNEPVSILMNNAGTIETVFSITEDNLERTVSVNYAGHYLLVRKLLPHMKQGSRILNMISCTYPIGRIQFPYFFTHGRKGSFQRLLVYSNTKLSLLLFTIELAQRVKEKGIVVNAIDPGIVSTDMITMQKWFDPLADIFFRPFIRKPEKGAAMAVRLLLDKKYGGVCGELFLNSVPKKLSSAYRDHPLRKKLWEETEKIVRPFL